MKRLGTNGKAETRAKLLDWLIWMKLGLPGASPWAPARETPIMRRRTTTMLNVKCQLSNNTLSCENFRSWFFVGNDTLKGSQNPGATHIPWVPHLSIIQNCTKKTKSVVLCGPPLVDLILPGALKMLSKLVAQSPQMRENFSCKYWIQFHGFLFLQVC